jgi:uncharacterized protein YecE (DUF72 family)
MSGAAGVVRVGTSGWRYAGWRGDFFPAGLPQRRELEYAAQRMTSLEINGSFYSLQRPSSYRTWSRETPEDLVFAVKGGRFITHMKKLRDVEAPLANFFASGVLALGAKLGPFLWQLPENLPFDAERLDRFLGMLPRTTEEAASLASGHDDKIQADRVLTTVDADRPLRHALEPRHASYASRDAVQLLRHHGVACVLADTAGRWPRLDEDTSDFRYVRLHGEQELYASGYTDESLDRWAGRCLEWSSNGQDVFVYFDNDAKGHAPYDAMRLIERVAG